MSFREAEERYTERLFALYTAEPAPIEKAPLFHVEFADGSEDYYESDCPQAMALMRDHISEAKLQGQAYTLTSIEQD